MAQSLVRNYLHIVFSTKNRAPLILPSVEDELYRYLGAICSNLECLPLKIGGHVDHVHVLCLLSKKITLIRLMEELKSSSSKWIKSKDEKLKGFYWQNGYGAFSVNPSEIEIVRQYIENQHEHHRKKPFSMNTGHFWRNIKLSTTKSMCGIDPLFNYALSGLGAWLIVTQDYVLG